MNPLQRERRQYNPVSHDEDQPEQAPTLTGETNDSSSNNNETTANDEELQRLTHHESSGDDSNENNTYSRNSSFEESAEKRDDDDDDDDDIPKIKITILDFTQKRFELSVSPEWTVSQLKQAGAAVHKVAPARQRLIYRGKMLADHHEDNTLWDHGIRTNGTILHLFPKPRVVLVNNNEQTPQETNTGDDDEENSHDGDEETGARVPTIVMDAAEAERRSQILVLGSTDFIEAQNNVKLFSFMLLVISSIELLNLLGILMGVPQEEQAQIGIPTSDETNNPSTDDFFAEHYNSTSSASDQDPVEYYLSHWGMAQNIDTIISVLGVYVALLGLKASTENTLRMAQRYLVSLVVVGAGWMLYNFFQTLEIEHKVEEKNEHQPQPHDDSNHLGPRPRSESDMWDQAVQVMVLPGIVWLMCWLRAWQFQRLLQEAEQEAAGRIQAQLDLAQQDEEMDATHHDINNNTAAAAASTTANPNNHDEEMALQNRNGILI